MGRSGASKKRSAMGPLFTECQMAIQGEINKLNLSGSPQEPISDDNERLPIEGLNGKRINDRFAEIATTHVGNALRDICNEKDTTRFTQTRWKKELTKRTVLYLQQSGQDLGEMSDKMKDIVADFIAIYISTQQFRKDLQMNWNRIAQYLGGMTHG